MSFVNPIGIVSNNNGQSITPALAQGTFPYTYYTLATFSVKQQVINNVTYGYPLIPNDVLVMVVTWPPSNDWQGNQGLLGPFMLEGITQDGVSWSQLGGNPETS